MNPSNILSRETSQATPPARKPQATRVDFRLPAEEARDATAARAKREDQVRRAELARNGRADAREAARQPDRNSARTEDSRIEDLRIEDLRTEDLRTKDSRGSDRSQQVRQDDRANRGEASSNRSDRADVMSNRDKTQHCDKDCDDANQAKAKGEQPLSAEDAARLALSETNAGVAVKVEAAGAEDKPVETPPAGVKAEAAAVITAEIQAVDGVPGLLQPASLATAAKIAEPPSEAEGEALGALTSGQAGNKTAHTLALPQGATLPDGAAQSDNVDPSQSGKTSSENTEGAKPKPDEHLSTPTRSAPDAKPEAGVAQPQPAATRTEALPPGLIALPDAARALQAQELDGKPGLGPQHNGQRAPESPPTSLAALPIEIGFRALSGTKRFDIRLDPPELGRVDVTLTFDKEGEVTAKLTVDRIETLHLLQRDAKTLERAFDQAGLRPSDAGVQISLSDRNAGNGSGFEAEQERGRGKNRRDDGDVLPSGLIEMAPLRRVRLGGVDVNV